MWNGVTDIVIIVPIWLPNNNSNKKMGENWTNEDELNAQNLPKWPLDAMVVIIWRRTDMNCGEYSRQRITMMINNNISPFRHINMIRQSNGR